MKKNKGIILAGGKGLRLRPFTKIFSKHFIPIYNKPMIFYSLSILIYAGIKEILLICNKEDIKNYKKLIEPIKVKNKLKLQFQIQNNSTGGIAESLIIAPESFKKNVNKILLILGDNFFYGREFPKILNKIITSKQKNAYVFLSPVSNPSQFGIAYLNKKKQISKIIEKPKNIKSNLAVTGLYIYEKKCFEYVKRIKRSKRGELEITSLNNLYLKLNKLKYFNLGRGITWFDMGTPEKIFDVSEFIKLIEKKKGFSISNL
tara:strand:+ start:649 stop:1428 length:780 start_codon:yes stop_codon:yes gene_type:complete